jgi:pyruvate,water dikinase
LDVKKIEDEGGNLNVKGLDLLIVNIKECWASLFSKNVLILAKEKQINLNKFSIAVIIQEMIDAKTSGILKTSIDENNPKICSIEAIFGLGGRLVLENTNPDYYQTNKTFFEVTQEINNIQKWKLVRNKGKTVKEEIPIKDQKNKKLDKLALKDLTNVAKKVEAYFGTPQVIEWVINKKDIFVLNSEPVDYDLEENKHNKNDLQQRISGFKNKFIVKGVPASKGIAKGTIKIIKNKEDYKKIDEDSIILTDMTNTSMLDIIKKSKAVITKGGSAICNAAVISQKLAKPCVVNIQNLDLFKENQRVQVNGTNGEIYSVQGVEIKNNNFNKKSNNFKNAKKEINNIRKNLFSNNNLDIRNIEKIDLNNIKNVEFPINYLFTEKEILELKNKSTKEIISEIRTKIEKIISKI